VNRPPSSLTMLLSRHTRRREFITLLGVAATTWPLTARAQYTAQHTAQQQRVYRIGLLVMGGRTKFIDAIADTLRGHVEGKNVAIERRFADGRLDRARILPSARRQGG
jgi:putative tryptophan/tyrosine transport system substrate-binding protein